MVPDPGPGNFANVNLAGAGALPRLDMEAATAPGRGTAAIGEGLQRAGSALGQMAEKKAEADSIVAERHASLLMAKANADISAAVAGEADQSKWGDIATARMGALQGELAKINVDPKTRETIAYKYAANHIDVVDGLKTHANRKSLADAAQAIGDTVSDAANMEDEALADSTIAGGVARKLISPEQGNLLKERFRGIVKERAVIRQKESILGAVREDPQQALAILQDDRLQVSESTRAWGINAAQQGIREATALAVNDMENEIAKGLGGGLPNPQAVDEWAEKWEKDHPGQPKFSPAMKATARGHIVRMNDATARATMAANGPVIASRLWSEVDAFDVKTATRETYLQLKARIAELPAEMQSEVQGPLEAKWNGTPAPEQRTVLAHGERILNSMLRSGAFGPLSRREAVLRVEMKDGVPVEGAKPQPDYDPNGELKTREIAEPKWYQQALTDKAKAGGDFRRWLALNPKATEEQATQYLWQSSSGATRAGMFDVLDAQLKAETTPAAPSPAPVQPPAVPVESTEEELPDDETSSLGSGGGPSSNVSLLGDLDDNPDTVGQDDTLLSEAAPLGVELDMTAPDAATAIALANEEAAALKRRKKR